MPARKIEPGSTYLVTRRTQERQFLFKPDAAMKILFLYLLAFCANACGIEVNVAVLMSTHEHLVITDPKGALPVFLQRFHRLVAIKTKQLRGLVPYHCVWDKRPTSAVALLTVEAVVEKMAYAIFNPSDANIAYADWPGVTTRVDELGQAVWTLRRPDGLFKNLRLFPEHVTLHLRWPPLLLAQYGAERLREMVARELARLQAERDAQIAAAATPPPTATPEELANVSHLQHATTAEPPRARRNPTFAVGRGNQELQIAAALAVRDWRARYQAALDRWRAGDHTAVFPEHTWLMRRLHAAPTAPAAAPAAN